jgi:hypothetical protein
LRFDSAEAQGTTMADEIPSKTAKDERKTSLSHDVDVAIQEAPVAVLGEGSLDPVYEAKARILNKAIQDIGMGRYQWQVRINISYCWPCLSCHEPFSAIHLSV